MSTRITRTPTPLSDVLYAFSLAKPIPDAELLDDFVRRYPEYAADLTDFAIELIINAPSSEVENENAPAETTTVMDPAVSRAMSRFQNRLYVIQQAKAEHSVTAPVENPFADLDRPSLRSLAQRLNANAIFIMKLRDRQIDPNTMTDGFRQRVADELLAPLDVVVAHFAAKPQVQVRSQFYKADQKPEAGDQQTLEGAVRSSGLTPDQQHYLLSL